MNDLNTKRLSDNSNNVLGNLLNAVESQKASLESARKTLAATQNPLDQVITSIGNEPWVLSENPALEEEINQEDAILGDELLKNLEKKSRVFEQRALETLANQYFDEEVQAQELLIAKAHEIHARTPMGARSDMTRGDFRKAVQSATNAITILENQRSSFVENIPIFLELSERMSKLPTLLVSPIDQAALEFVPDNLKNLFPDAESSGEKSPFVENPSSVDSE